MSNNNGGLVYEEESDNQRKIFVEIKPDTKLVRKCIGEESERLIAQSNNNEILPKGFRVRTLEMGENKGKEVAEEMYNSIPNVQLLKVSSEEVFGQRKMQLLFNNMQDDSPDVQVQCTLINDRNSVNGYASNFIDKMPNIKIGTSMTVRIKKYTNKDTGKEKRYIEITQNNKIIQSAFWDYDKNKPKGGKPSATLKEKKIMGEMKEVWDYTKVAEFQLDLFQKFSQDVETYWDNSEKPKSKKLVEEVEEEIPF
tara:strand:- start:1737 stop:2495 length:759 start_codon:yes stop_codon:yes gene_type:complete